MFPLKSTSFLANSHCSRLLLSDSMQCTSKNAKLKKKLVTWQSMNKLGWVHFKKYLICSFSLVVFRHSSLVYARAVSIGPTVTALVCVCADEIHTNT